MAERIRRKINLLPNKGDTLINQFLSWALTVGRLLVIITETLALSVFIYRFSLDVKIIDLHDKIKTQSIIVENFQEGENTFRDLQTRLASANTYDATDDKSLKILKDILEMGQNRVTFRNITVTSNSIELEVQSPSASTLSLFTRALKSYPEVNTLSIERVENQTSTATVTVSINAELKGAKPTVSPKPGRQGGNQL